MKKDHLMKIAAISVLVLFLGGLATAQETPIPIPQKAEVIIWMRGDQVAGDPDLKATVLRSRGMGHYLDLLNLALEQIDYAVLFTPFASNLFNGSSRSGGDLLPSDGAFIAAGNFDPKAKYGGFKSKGWLEKEYANKKLLWWSTGEKYYCDPVSGECVGYLPGGRLVVAGSEAIMKDILDVSGSKKEGFIPNDTYQRLNDDFFGNRRSVMSLYSTVTNQMKYMAKNDTVYIKSPMARSAVEYIDHLERVGIASVKNTGDYNLNGLLDMDSQNNALVVSSLLQIGGGLANLLPPDDPSRAILANVVVSRQDRVVLMQATVTKKQLMNLIR